MEMLKTDAKWHLWLILIYYIFKNQAGQNRTGKKGFGGGGLRVESCGGWGCGEVGPDGGTTVEGSSSRNWCAQ